MEKIARLNQEERQGLFTETATAKRITAAAAEKDFWICWVLMVLFDDPDLSKVLRFKGGTALSKCFGAIERFSEDIDLILDWQVLTTDDPEAERSRTKQNKFNEEVNQQAQVYIAEVLLPLLQSLMTDICLAEIDADDPHTINVRYPSSFKDTYQRDQIRLEIGPLAKMLPYDKYLVKPYAAEIFPGIFEKSEISVEAIRPERTFWEKITILHAESHRPDDKPQPQRYSRHYYDVYQMLDTDIEQAALADLSLFDAVVEFKKKFYYSGWARFDLATLPTISLKPGAKVMSSLENDYLGMREMIFGDYPDFKQIMTRLEEYQQRLRLLGEEAKRV